MSRGVGFIVSASEPSSENLDIWCKPTSTAIEWYERIGQQWVLRESVALVAVTDIASAIANHTADANAHHPTNSGITGSKTVGNYRLTFTNGLLTGFEQV